MVKFGPLRSVDPMLVPKQTEFLVPKLSLGTSMMRVPKRLE